jgi:hypothetical protein
MDLMRLLNNDEPLDNVALSVIHQRLPDTIRATLFDPYMADDGNQLRFAVRVIDSYPDLDRGALIEEFCWLSTTDETKVWWAD